MDWSSVKCPILVNAWDEIMMAGVRVMVHDEHGKLVEAGDARQFQKDWWEYTLQAEGRGFGVRLGSAG